MVLPRRAEDWTAARHRLPWVGWASRLAQPAARARQPLGRLRASRQFWRQPLSYPAFFSFRSRLWCLARDQVWLVIFKAKPVQKRDQPRTAFINNAKLRLNPGPDLTGRARQTAGNPGFKCCLLAGAELAGADLAGAAAAAKTGQPVKAVLAEQLMSLPDRVVIDKQGLGHPFTAPARIQKHQRIGPPRQTMRRRPVPRQCDQVFAVLKR